MRDKLIAIGRRVGENIEGMIGESSDSIEAAVSACKAEARVQEGGAQFRIGVSVVLDLDHETMTTSLSYGVKHRLEVAGEIPDPNQPELIDPEERPRVRSADEE